jgi:hypothetical protein
MQTGLNMVKSLGVSVVLDSGVTATVQLNRQQDFLPLVV